MIIRKKLAVNIGRSIYTRPFYIVSYLRFPPVFIAMIGTDFGLGRGIQFCLGTLMFQVAIIDRVTPLDGSSL